MLNQQQIYLFGQIITSQTGDQPYSDTSPYDECSINKLICVGRWLTKALSLTPPTLPKGITNSLITKSCKADLL